MEFGSITKRQYFNKALDLATSKADGVNILERTLSNGRVATYDVVNNYLVIVHNGNDIRTFFRPTRGIDYFRGLR